MSDTKDQAPKEQNATGTVPDPGVTPPKPSWCTKIYRWFKTKVSTKTKSQVRDN